MNKDQRPWDVINVDDGDDWDNLIDICNGYLKPREKDELREYLRGDVRSVLVEHEYVDKDYRDTFYNYYSKKFANYPHKAIRLHFFSDTLVSSDLWEMGSFHEDYIGFVVVRPTRVTCLGRTVLDPRKLSRVHGNIPLAPCEAHVFGSQMDIGAFPAIRQDSDVTICAHAACWSLFRYFSRKYGYSEVHPYEITQMTSDVKRGRLVPSLWGISIHQVSEIFSEFGVYPEYFDRDFCDSDGEFERILYTYIESGLPVVAGLPKHAVTLFGHVSDYGKPVSANDYVYSDTYLKSLIGNDDNSLPYQQFPCESEDLTPSSHMVNDKRLDEIESFVVPLPEKMFLSAARLFPLVEKIVFDSPIGFEHLNDCVDSDELVLRVFLASSRSFKKCARNRILPSVVRKGYLEQPMPKFIWVCELSTKEKYSEGQVFGEIIFDSTASDRDRFSFMVIHYPESLIINDRHAMEAKNDRFTGPIDLADPKWYPVFAHNLEDIK